MKTLWERIKEYKFSWIDMFIISLFLFAIELIIFDLFELIKFIDFIHIFNDIESIH